MHPYENGLVAPLQCSRHGENTRCMKLFCKRLAASRLLQASHAEVLLQNTTQAIVIRRHKFETSAIVGDCQSPSTVWHNNTALSTPHVPSAVVANSSPPTARSSHSIMVNISSWEEFVRQADELYASSPSSTRFTLKYRHRDQSLVLKVTDDRKCLKYATEHYRDLKKLERLTDSFLRKMSSK